MTNMENISDLELIELSDKYNTSYLVMDAIRLISGDDIKTAMVILNKPTLLDKKLVFDKVSELFNPTNAEETFGFQWGKLGTKWIRDFLNQDGTKIEHDIRFHPSDLEEFKI